MNVDALVRHKSCGIVIFSGIIVTHMPLPPNDKCIEEHFCGIKIIPLSEPFSASRRIRNRCGRLGMPMIARSRKLCVKYREYTENL